MRAHLPCMITCLTMKVRGRQPSMTLYERQLKAELANATAKTTVRACVMQDKTGVLALYSEIPPTSIPSLSACSAWLQAAKELSASQHAGEQDGNHFLRKPATSR